MRFKKIVPAHVEERTTCDLCGNQVSGGGYGGADEVEIGAKIGDVWPEGDQRVAYEADVCGPCFLEKVVPALAAIGLTFRTRDVEGKDDGRVLDQRP